MDSSKGLCPKAGWHPVVWYHVQCATCWLLVKKELYTQDVEPKLAPELMLPSHLNQLLSSWG